MELLVVGSIALDTVVTPISSFDNALGGSTTYISLAASYFCNKVNIVGVVGDDFPEEHIKLLKEHKGNLDGLQIVKGGKTFRWGGKYHDDLNDRDTLFTELNVFEFFNPIIPESYKNNKYVMLGNIDPDLQMNVLNQLENKFVICDSMNLWMNIKLESLLNVIKKVDVLIINDSEAKQLSKNNNLIKAAEIIQNMGCKYLIIKKGEHGALLFGNEKVFSAPALPIKEVFDPTGAGDTFAGGFAGYLSQTDDISFENMKKAVIYGSTLASFNVEKASTKGIENLTKQQIEDRYNKFKELAGF